MRLLAVLLVCLGLSASGVTGAQVLKDPPPTQDEVSAAMYFVGFGLQDKPPKIREMP